MDLDRVELADLKSPAALAREIHRQLGRASGAVPIIEIARALDIVKIDLRKADGYEGMLITDGNRSRGGILANTAKGPKRARFTIAHELGHFLMDWHVQTYADGFRCRPEDMRETRVASRHQRQEVEANRFAAEVLAPAHLVAPWIDRDVDLAKALDLGRTLHLSQEASVRRYIERHHEPLAAIWSTQGCIRYFAANESFPKLARHARDMISSATRAHRVIAAAKPGRSEMKETDAAAWLRDPDHELFEQTRLGDGGRAVTLLWATRPDEDPDEDDAVHRPLTTPGFGRRG